MLSSGEVTPLFPFFSMYDDQVETCASEKVDVDIPRR